MNKLIALTFIMLMLSSTFALAIDQVDEDQIYGKEEIGEDIVVNVDEYQPKTIRTSLLEEQDVRVYALLKGIPSNPSISIDRIKKIDVKVKSVKTSPEGKDIDIANVRYIKPGRSNTFRDQIYDFANGRRTSFLDSLGTGRQGELGYSTQGGLGYSQQLDYDNLGFVEITLKKIKKEADVPEQVDVELEGTIDFDVSGGAGAGPRTDILAEQTDAEWQPEKELHKFYGGYIRVDRIGTGRTAAEDVKDFRQPYQGLYLDQYRSDLYADIALYDLHGMPINPIPTITTDPVEGDHDLGIRERLITLRETQTSPAYRSPTVDQTGTQLFNRFKVQLKDIRAEQPSVDALIQVGDSTPFVSKIGRGMRVHPDSQWTLKSIDKKVDSSGRTTYVLTFKSIRNVPDQKLEIQELGQSLGAAQTTNIALTQANAEVVAAQQAVEAAQTELQRVQTSRESPALFEKAQADLKTAQQNLKDKQAAADLIRSPLAGTPQAMVPAQPDTCVSTIYTPLTTDLAAFTEKDITALREYKNKALAALQTTSCLPIALKDLDTILLQYRRIINLQAQQIIVQPDAALLQEANDLKDIIHQARNSPTPTFTENTQNELQTGTRQQAIQEYYNFIESYNQLEPQDRQGLEQQYADAHYKLALIYMSAGDDQKAIDLLHTYAELPSDITSQTKQYVENILIPYLENNIHYTNNKLTLPESGRPPTIISIFPTASSLESDATADLIINLKHDPTTQIAKSSIHIGERVFTTDVATRLGIKETDYDYVLNSIDVGTAELYSPSKKTTVSLRYSTIGGGPLAFTIPSTNPTPDSKQLIVEAQLQRANVQYEAVVTIIPVQEQAFSTVNFNLHLPIEKRAIELPLFSSSIDKEINKTQKLIKDVDKLVNTVGKLHEVWSKLCLTTFGVLWAKNLLSPNKGFARREISDHWKNKWNADRQTGKIPQSMSFDSYLIENSETYDTDLESTTAIFDRIDQGAYKQVGTQFNLDAQTVKENEADLKSYYIAQEKIKTDPGYLNEYVTRRIQLTNLKTVQEIETLQTSQKVEDNLKLKQKVEEVTGVLDDSKWKANQQEYIGTYLAVQQQVNLRTSLGLANPNDLSKALSEADYTNGANKVLENSGLDDARKQQLQSDTEKALATLAGNLDRANSNSLGISETELVKSKDDPSARAYLDKRTNTEHQLYYAFDPTSPTKPPRSTSLLPKQEELEDSAKLTAAGYALVTPAVIPLLADKNLPVYYVSSTNTVVPSSITTKANTAQHKSIITQYPKGDRHEGKTQYVTIDAYRYIGYEYGTGGRVTSRKVYTRAIPNSPPGGGSDILESDYLTVYNSYNNEKATPEQRVIAKDMKNVDSCLSKFNRAFEKDLVPSNPLGSLAGSVQCGQTNYRVGKSAPPPAGPSCTDFMDPGDCHILFNACDPVICPASRCNLGGQWQVENVVATGLVGSVSLCALNFPEVAVPVCITGIRAGLQNIKSILEGYNQCLITSKNEGQSVGICDRVRNVYVCEILWKEGVAIFNIKGGLLSFAAEKLFGEAQGGDEYSDFSAHFDNSVKGLQYFTQDYAKNVFAGYDGGSLDEIGTNICKNAIYGKAPGVGNFFNDIQKPESPPQFMAFFDEAAYTDIKTTPESLYSVYYHIYAGDNEDVRYTVFLRSTDAAGQIVSNVKYLANNQALQKGQNADENKEFTGLAGYNEICVIISTTRYGKIQQCGFGKVSTDFAVNYLNEKYINSQAAQQISNEKDCSSDNTQLSSLSYQGGSSFSGNTNLAQVGVGSVSTGLLQTGIVRKCSSLDLNRGYVGSPDGPWTVVGSCGQDEQGRDLGQCWLYKPSVLNSLKQESSEKDFNANLRNLTRDLENEGLTDTPELDNKQTDDALVAANAILTSYQTTCSGNLADARTSYTQISSFGATDNQRALAHYQLAESYLAEYHCTNKGTGEPVTPEQYGLDVPEGFVPPVTTPTTSIIPTQPGAIDYNSANTLCDAYTTFINTEASKYDLPPNLIRAIILRESACKADATSSANAMGLMQVMQSGAVADVTTPDKPSYNYCGKDLINAVPTLSSNYYDPDTNIKVGTCYFAYLHNDYVPKQVKAPLSSDEFIRKALYAYNAGPSDNSLNNPTPNMQNYATDILKIYHALQDGTTLPSGTSSGQTSVPGNELIDSKGTTAIPLTPSTSSSANAQITEFRITPLSTSSIPLSITTPLDSHTGERLTPNQIESIIKEFSNYYTDSVILSLTNGQYVIDMTNGNLQALAQQFYKDKSSSAPFRIIFYVRTAKTVTSSPIVFEHGEYKDSLQLVGAQDLDEDSRIWTYYYNPTTFLSTPDAQQAFEGADQLAFKKPINLANTFMIGDDQQEFITSDKSTYETHNENGEYAGKVYMVKPGENADEFLGHITYLYSVNSRTIEVNYQGKIITLTPPNTVVSYNSQVISVGDAQLLFTMRSPDRLVIEPFQQAQTPTEAISITSPQNMDLELHTPIVIEHAGEQITLVYQGPVSTIDASGNPQRVYPITVIKDGKNLNINFIPKSTGSAVGQPIAILSAEDYPVLSSVLTEIQIKEIKSNLLSVKLIPVTDSVFEMSLSNPLTKEELPLESTVSQSAYASLYFAAPQINNQCPYSLRIDPELNLGTDYAKAVLTKNPVVPVQKYTGNVYKPLCVLEFNKEIKNIITTYFKSYNPASFEGLTFTVLEAGSESSTYSSITIQLKST